jgi:phosphoribosylglycinamide formyltransferase-1
VESLSLAVFASGRGSNFSAILKAIEARYLKATIRVLITNNKKAGALEIAQDHQIATEIVNRQDYDTRDSFIKRLVTTLAQYSIDLIVLAGYMKRIPPELIRLYRNRMLNIHPALLPSFGGKGMYGHHVHSAVLKRGCKVTGVTVHIVDEEYDHGPIVIQKCVPVNEEDTPETLAASVLKVEHDTYWRAIQLFAENRITVKEGRVYIRG